MGHRRSPLELLSSFRLLRAAAFSFLLNPFSLRLRSSTRLAYTQFFSVTPKVFTIVVFAIYKLLNGFDFPYTRKSARQAGEKPTHVQSEWVLFCPVDDHSNVRVDPDIVTRPVVREMPTKRKKFAPFLVR
jgi:hypothetical protein